MDKKCGHGIRYNEECEGCEIINLTASLEWMAPVVKKDKARLKKLTGKSNGR